MTPDTPYWVAFTRIAQVGRARIERLERAFGTLAAAWQASAADLAAAGLDARTVRAIVAGRERIDPAAEMATLERAGVQALTWHDPAYPRLLRESFDRPPVLYVRGTLKESDEAALAVVGTRRMSVYGRQVTEDIVTELVRAGITIVSGLAHGIDGCAHATALREGGRTIAVLASGLDIIYPAANAGLARRIMENGALVSEHPLGTRPQRDLFPRRNRIIAALSLGVIVTEAPEQSGALLTAKFAADDNRDVFAVPGSIYAPGCIGTNLLIQEGAKLVRTARDVLEELNFASTGEQAELAAAMPAADGESALLGCLSDGPCHIDELVRGSGLSAAEASSALALLELKGRVRQVGPMQYVRVREEQAAYSPRPRP